MTGSPATRAPIPNAIATLAPRAPPPETPSVRGSAKGLRNIACNAAPTTPSEAPTTPAINTRGRRSPKKMSRARSSVHSAAKSSR